MNKARINYYIDILLVICLMIVSITGLVLFFAFESNAPRIGRSITFLGTYKSAWLPWHNFFGIAMVILMFIHLVLHWNWLICMTKNLFKK